MKNSVLLIESTHTFHPVLFVFIFIMIFFTLLMVRSVLRTNHFNKINDIHGEPATAPYRFILPKELVLDTKNPLIAELIKESSYHLN